MIALTNIPQGKTLRFSFFGHAASVNSGIVSYNYIRRQFYPYAEQAAHYFESEYHKCVKSLDAIVKDTPKIFLNSMATTWKDCINALAQCGIVGVDMEHFIFDYYGPYDHWESVYNILTDKYAEITLEQKELDEYRRRRREGRGRFEGGGFGISGAVKGMAVTEIANLASGAVHMLFNGLGKIGSSIAASSQKSEIFQDPNTLYSLMKAVYDSVIDCHCALISCLNHKAGTKFIPYIRSEKAEQLASIINNLKMGLIPEEGRWEAILTAFSCSPYNYKWYDYMLSRFKDPDGELDNAADYFKVNIDGTKQRYIEAALGKVDLSTMETAGRELERLKLIMKQYHYSGDIQAKTDISKAIDKFDREQRSVPLGKSGKRRLTLKTVEDAEIAKRQIPEVDELLRAFDYENEDGCRNALAFLDTMDILPEVKKLFASFFQKKCDEFEKEACTVFGRVYDSREKAKQIKAEYEEIKKQLEDPLTPRQLQELKCRIQENDFPNDIKDELNHLAYEVENKKELVKVWSVNFVAAVIVIAMLIIGWNLKISATEALHETHVMKNGIELLLHDHVITDTLTFVDGLKNNVVVFSKSIICVVLGAFADYLDGFNGAVNGHIMWLLLGWVKTLCDNIWLGLERYFVSLWYTFRQSTDVAYCAGYIISTACSWLALIRLSKEEDKLVQKLKDNKKEDS